MGVESRKLFSKDLVALLLFAAVLTWLRHAIVAPVTWHPRSLVSFAAFVVLLTWTTSRLRGFGRGRHVYLVEYACCLPKRERRMPCPALFEHSILCGSFNADSLTFQRKILARSGLGNETYLPQSLHYIPPRTSTPYAFQELHEVLFSSLSSLFSLTGLPPSSVSILIVNSSLFNPTPSLSSLIVNKFGLRPDIQSFNLSGMGCSAGLVSIDLAKRLLSVKSGDCYALIVSTENITQNCYLGNQRSMLLPNCLFRMGGAAILLSNRPEDKTRAKYRLSHTVRTHKGSDDAAYRCVYQEQDEKGETVGVSLTKDLIAIAGEALKTNLTTLAPLVLPISEQLRFLAAFIARWVGLKTASSGYKPYIPDFKLAFEHFCIHAGGRAVIDELEKHLRLSPRHVEPSRMTLHRFGNTSSSSIWYELAYLEAKGEIRSGHRIWQIGFGSGFKCNSAVWVALRTIPINRQNTSNPWFDCIDYYPVPVQDYVPL